MIYLSIRHLVDDYKQWKEGFDMHTAARQAGNATGEVYVMCNMDEPDEIIVILGWRSLRHARAFMQSVSWQMALEKMGVVGLPEVYFWERVG